MYALQSLSGLSTRLREITGREVEQIAVDLCIVLTEEWRAAGGRRRRGHSRRWRRIFEPAGDGMLDGAEEVALPEMR